MRKSSNAQTVNICIAIVVSFLVVKNAYAQETSINGLFFGDYFATTSHHDDQIEGANGFRYRRLYLNINTRFNSSWDSRVRFESNSPGNFTSSAKLEPFIKDLWVRWLKGRHSIIMGLSSTPTKATLESEWGYRDLEKTPLDLYKYASGRDFGVAFKGSFDEERKLRYHIMVGNGSGTKGETDKGKKIAGALTLYPISNLVFEVEAEHEERSGDTDRRTLTGMAVIKGDRGKIGFMFARHFRETSGWNTGMRASYDKQDIFSAFGILNASSKVDLVARWDRILDPVPDGEKISYIPIAEDSKGNLILLGIDVGLDDNVHVIPNLEIVTYDEAGIESDVFFRTTLSVIF